MEARFIRLVMAMSLICNLVNSVSAQLFRQSREFTAHSQNFIVFAATPEWATQVAQVAEQHRRELAIHWLGEELPPWPERCPVHVNSSPNLGAQGETRYTYLDNGRAGSWMMIVTGTPERILDSVLPHEITHAIFASHFAALGKYVPRWADEGACTTVEHELEKRKHRQFLVQFLKTGRGLAFNSMFRLKEYPADILPLYAQGHSAVQFLIDQGGAQKFIRFLEAGMQADAWPAALNEFYAYENIGEFQLMWNQWLADGSPAELISYAPSLRAPDASDAATLASNTPAGKRPFQLAVGSTAPAPVTLAGNIQSEPELLERVLPNDPISLSDASLPSANALSRNDLRFGQPDRNGSQFSDIETAKSNALSSNEGWYKRRLTEISGAPATPVPEHNTVAQDGLRQRSQARVSSSTYPGLDARGQSVSRPRPAQSPGIQVLDWGVNGPVQGIQSPIYR
jgi:hypothetical protein